MQGSLGASWFSRPTEGLLSKQTALLQQDRAARMLLPMGGLSATLTSRLRSFRGKLIHQIVMLSVKLPPEASKPWYLAARLKKPPYGMNDAPRKWWNRLDAAVKAMGLLPARADRCTYVSYTDVKKKKMKQVVHATGDNEATQSFEQTGHSLNEDSYNEVYENILQQLMETDEYEKLRVWTFGCRKREMST